MIVRIIILIVFINSDVKAQIFECPDSEIFQVTAPSGLNLRESNNVKSEIIGVIPYNDYLEFCYCDDEKLLIIEKLKGCWARVIYRGVLGYVFSGYLKETEVKLEFLGELGEHYLEYEKSNYYALQKVGEYGYFTEFKIISFDLEKYFFIENMSIGHMKIFDDDIVFIFRGIENTEDRIFGMYHDYKFLYPGEIVYLDSSTILFANGTPIDNEIGGLNPFNMIKEYSVSIRSIRSGNVIEQILYETDNCYIYGSSVTFNSLKLIWTGDIDRDGKPDVLLQIGDDLRFYTSTKTIDDELLLNFVYKRTIMTY